MKIKEKNLEGKIIKREELKDMGFEEVDRIEHHGLYWFGKKGEEIMALRLLAYKEAFQLLSHYEKQ